jgi:hypothetical protein
LLLALGDATPSATGIATHAAALSDRSIAQVARRGVAGFGNDTSNGRGDSCSTGSAINTIDHEEIVDEYGPSLGGAAQWTSPRDGEMLYLFSHATPPLDNSHAPSERV